MDDPVIARGATPMARAMAFCEIPIGSRYSFPGGLLSDGPGPPGLRGRDARGLVTP